MNAVDRRRFLTLSGAALGAAALPRFALAAEAVPALPSPPADAHWPGYDKTLVSSVGKVDRHPDALMKIRTAADLETAKAAKRLGLIYGFQDTLPLGEDLDRITTFHGLGVRVDRLAPQPARPLRGTDR